MKSRHLKIISVFLAINFLFELIFPTMLFALTGGPRQPEMEPFTEVSGSDLVDPYSGDFNYKIPLMVVPGAGDGYPIDLTYNAGVGVEQEASWVGLGWNLNPGCISRELRGIPDDCDGAKIKQETHILPNITWGISASGPVKLPEIFGLDLNSNVDMGLFYNNYRGFGVDFGYNVSLKRTHYQTKFKKLGENDSIPNTIANTFKLNSSVNLNSQNGSVFDLGLSWGLAKNRNDVAGAGFHVNSRAGSYYELLAGTGQFKARFPSSSTIINIDNEFNNYQIVEEGKVGIENGGIFTNVPIEVSFDKQIIRHESVENSAYGYCYSENAGNDGLLDFTREDDMPLSSNIPFLAMPIATYDNFNVQSLNCSGSFRAFRSDIGVYKDPDKENYSDNITVSGEVGAGTTAKVGIKLGYGYSSSEYGGWSDMDDFISQAGFKAKLLDNPNYEPFYFKFTDDWSANLPNNDHRFQLDNLIHIQMSMPVNGSQAKAYNQGAVTQSERSSRYPRNRNIQYKTIEEIRLVNQFLYQSSNAPKHIFSNGNFISYNYDRYYDQSSDYVNKQIGEFTITQEDGSNYVFGLPAYNILTKSVTFSTNSSTSLYQAVDWIPNYPTEEASLDNKAGREQYYNSNTSVPYAYAYYLTSILSSDYKDTDGVPGPSSGDLGTFTKFNYKEITNSSLFKWRIPFSGAYLNKGNYSDAMDDKASYTYGEKEIFYLHSVETQTHIAVFYTSSENRLDAQGANREENCSPNLLCNVVRPHRLDSICLYLLKDYKNNVLKSLKTVVFSYSHGLCPNLPNSINGVGKLTLTAVKFVFFNNRKGELSPYQFFYSSSTTPYNHSFIDKWGNYQITNTVWKQFNNENPYVDQSNNQSSIANRNHAANVWNLNKILLPSGGEINIILEPDDYGYVQNEKAMQMTRIIGTLPNESTNFNDITNKIDKDHLRICFELNQTISLTEDLIVKDYLPGNDEIYFKVFERVKKDNQSNFAYDYVEGFAKTNAVPDNYGLIEDPYSSGNSEIGYVDIEPIDVNGILELGTNPMQIAGWKYLKMERNDLLFPSQNWDELNYKQVANMFKSLAAGFMNLIVGYENTCFINNWASEFLNDNTNSNFHPSFIRLNNPNMIKYGGGHRVKSLSVTDNWLSQAGESSMSYSQEYEYRTIDEGRLISSGVAEYEPLIGPEEIPQYSTVFYKGEKNLIGAEDDFRIKLPIGESFYPGAKVGYSKIIVRSNSGITDNQKSKSGITVYEFYTSKEYPIKLNHSDILYVRSPNWSIIPETPLGSYSDKGNGYSQAYTIEQNNMPGKLKCSSTFTDTESFLQSNPLKSVKFIYTYNEERAGRGYNKQDNDLKIINNEGLGQTAESGIAREFYMDIRETKATSYDISVSGDIDIPVPPAVVVTVWPMLHYIKDYTRTVVTNKIINRIGILKKVETNDNGSIQTKSNLVFDAINGTPVLTSTTNDYNAPVYNMNYPAYHSFSQMGPSFSNYKAWVSGYLENDGTFIPNGSSGNFLCNGDLIYLKGENSTSIGLFWVKYKSNGSIEFLNNGGDTYFPNSPGVHSLYVVASGKGNQHMDSRGNISSLDNPLYVKNMFLEALNERLQHEIPSGITLNFQVKNCDGTIKFGDLECELVSNSIKVTKNPCPGFSLSLPSNMNILNFQQLYQHNFFIYGKKVFVVTPDPSSDTILCDPYYDPGNCFQDCLDGVLDATMYTFTDKKAYNSLPSGQHNDFRINQKNNYNILQTKKYFTSRINEDNIPLAGTYKHFIMYSNPASDPPNEDNWKWVSKRTKFNSKGLEIENENMLGKYSSAIFGFDNCLVTAIVNNSKTNESAFNSFEDYSSSSYVVCGNLNLSVANGTVSTLAAHSGFFSLSVGDGSILSIEKDASELPPFNLPYSKEYLISFWIKTDENVIVRKINGNGSTTNISSTISNFIDGWRKVEFKYMNEPSIEKIEILISSHTSEGLNYIDDFRIHPLEANMNTFIYDSKTTRLIAQQDENNFSFFYLYDESGNLIQTRRETINGIYTTKTNRQHIKY